MKILRDIFKENHLKNKNTQFKLLTIPDNREAKDACSSEIYCVAMLRFVSITLIELLDFYFVHRFISFIIHYCMLHLYTLVMHKQP